MRSHEFLAPAEEEMNEAARFYEQQSPGLGRDFLDAVQRTIEAIVANPNSGRQLSENIRRRRDEGFHLGRGARFEACAKDHGRVEVEADSHSRFLSPIGADFVENVFCGLSGEPEAAGFPSPVPFWAGWNESRPRKPPNPRERLPECLVDAGVSAAGAQPQPRRVR